MQPLSKVQRGKDSISASDAALPIMADNQNDKNTCDSPNDGLYANSSGNFVESSSESSSECSTDSLHCFSDFLHYSSSNDSSDNEDDYPAKTSDANDLVASDSNWEDIETDESTCSESSLSDDSKSETSDKVPYPKMAPVDLSQLDKQCPKEAYEDYLYLRQIICPSCKVSVPLKFYEEHTACHGFEY